MQVDPTKVQGGGICFSCNTDRFSLSNRGLCPYCQANGNIRAYYPVDRPRGVPKPTNALPGSADKIKVLEDRETRGQELWHPDDPAATDRDSRAHCFETYRERTQRQRLRDGKFQGQHDQWASKEQDDDDPWAD